MGLVGMISMTCTFFLYGTEIVRRRRDMFQVVLQLSTKYRTGPDQYTVFRTVRTVAELIV